MADTARPEALSMARALSPVRVDPEQKRRTLLLVSISLALKTMAGGLNTIAGALGQIAKGIDAYLA